MPLYGCLPIDVNLEPGHYFEAGIAKVTKKL